MSSDFNALVEDGLTPKVDPKPWMKEKTFTLVRDIGHLNEIIDKAIEAGLCALDLETTGLDNRIDKSGKTQDDVVGYCLSYDGNEGFYVPVKHYVQADSRGNRELHPLNLNALQVGLAMKRLTDNCVTIYHNSAFDLEFLYGLGSTVGIDIDKPSMFEDTLILDYLRDSTDKRHGLKHLAERFLGMEMIEIDELFRSGTKDRDFSTLDPSRQEVLWYAGSDGICTYLLFDFYCRHAADVKDYPHNLEGPVYEYKSPETIYGEQKNIYQIEKAMIPALRWTERNRPLVDMQYVENIKAECEALITETIKEIEEALCKNIHDKNIKDIHTFRNLYDVTSPQQLGQALEKLKQTNPAFKGVQFEVTEKSGQIKTDMESIEILASKYAETFPFLGKIQVFRRLQKVLGTYITPLYENTDWEGNPKGPYKRLNDSTIRFRFLPHRVDTGRFAASKGSPEHGYSGINVQSMPGTYNYAKFPVREVYKRPAGPGAAGASFVEGYEKAALKSDFLRHVYDRHFIRDNKTGAEYCIRKDCEGCPFAAKCQRSDPFTKTFYSLESAIRPALVARPGYVLVSIDFSGVELRVAANICEEPQWIKEFYRCGSCGHEFKPPTRTTRRAGKNAGVYNWKVNERPPSHCPTCGSDKIGDLHTLTAKIVYGDDVVNLPGSEFKQKRQSSKSVNFAIIYGGGGSAVARATGEPIEQGRVIRDRILNSLSTFGKWMDATIKDARKTQYVSTAVGRKIRLHDINSPEGWLRAKQERNAINSIVQGSATGDLIKYAMGSIYRACKDRGWLEDCRMMLTIHDELVFEIRQDKLDEIIPVINGCMTEFGDKMKWPIVLATDIEFSLDWSPGHNWREIHDVNVKTGVADAPVPSYLVGKIKFHPGMWHTDEGAGGDMVWAGGDNPGFIPMAEYKALFVAASENTENSGGDSPGDTASEAEGEDGDMGQEDNGGEAYDLSKLNEGKKSPELPRVNLPDYVHIIAQPLSSSAVAASYFLRLGKVERAFHALATMGKVTPTHVLVVKTIEGDTVLGAEEGVLVVPDIFEILAIYEGI